jgi:hypothetical protein
MSKQKTEKWITYAVEIQSALHEAFNNGSIRLNEFEDSENFKQFLHALSTVVPGSLFNKLTGDDKNFLEYNHLANKLCFEYLKNNETDNSAELTTP